MANEIAGLPDMNSWMNMWESDAAELRRTQPIGKSGFYLWMDFGLFGLIGGMIM